MTVQIFSTLLAMDMNEWIKSARLHARLTQEQLGEHLGVTKGNVWAWEKGNHEASLDQLIRIASITGFNEPLPGMGNKQRAFELASNDGQDANLPEDERQLLTAYRALGKKEKKYLLADAAKYLNDKKI